MTEALKALQKLNVCWKKIGHYSMKCKRIPGILGHHEVIVDNPVHSSDEESSIAENDAVLRSPNVVKFELQLYKAPEEKYLLDQRWVQGPWILFLDLCTAFLAQFRVL
ncbi:SNF1-related protein kinase catalytic subunit alpha KIN11-like [Chenopodium quinoa]|uniref:non-specific serine/threonine protein kinase n=1 Tax=Chenopodium quinoa TaxID=63459 RepID=A0A803L4U5_CHEQI|nr:SNF1-related protein kinase catalytic subunit alpha KIN11-like [Chenopodium quinoa]XP_021734632.1 SNF1-related protein kinase catalytic subunit alpha KIN11-like [Chenopodium quinoa]